MTTKTDFHAIQELREKYTPSIKIWGGRLANRSPLL